MLDPEDYRRRWDELRKTKGHGRADADFCDLAVADMEQIVVSEHGPRCIIYKPKTGGKYVNPSL